jgi:hypothetical protein
MKINVIIFTWLLELKKFDMLGLRHRNMVSDISAYLLFMKMDQLRVLDIGRSQVYIQIIIWHGCNPIFCLVQRWMSPRFGSSISSWKVSKIFGQKIEKQWLWILQKLFLSDMCHTIIIHTIYILLPNFLRKIMHHAFQLLLLNHASLLCQNDYIK